MCASMVREERKALALAAVELYRKGFLSFFA